MSFAVANICFEVDLGIEWASTAPFLGKNGTFDAYPRCAEITLHQELLSTPNGIRTRAATLKGWMHSKVKNSKGTGQTNILGNRISRFHVLGIQWASMEQLEKCQSTFAHCAVSLKELRRDYGARLRGSDSPLQKDLKELELTPSRVEVESSQGEKSAYESPSWPTRS